MKLKNKIIFTDGGKRWIKVKKLSLLVFLSFIVVLGTTGYALYYSPFPETLTETEKTTIGLQIEQINNKSIPIVNQGTFLKLGNLYDKPYVQRFGEGRKVVILTFDDGPDPRTTLKILETLQNEGVKGTFFVVGSQLYRYPEIGRKILAQGSDMGLHTYSHFENRKDEALSDLTFRKELDFTQKIFAYHFGYKSNIFRIPYFGLEDLASYNSLQFIREASERGMLISAPTVDSQDWNSKDPKVIKTLATNSEVQTPVILFHDAGGDRKATINALPEIIKFYKSRGYAFMTTTEFAKIYNLKTQVPLTIEDKILIGVSYNLYHFYKQSPAILSEGFLIGFLFVLVHIGIFVIMALIQLFKQRLNKKMPILQKPVRSKMQPLVSVIIPMHNEEKVIRGTISAVLKSYYKQIELILVDDGSTDGTVQKTKFYLRDTRVKLLLKNQTGKFSTLNYGIRQASGKIAVFIDADTRIKTRTISALIESFTDRKIGAVAGNILVGNKNNIKTRLQSLEYVLAQNIEKRACALFGSILVVPGAIGAWRISAIRKAGGFSNHTLSEDFDLTLSIIKLGYKVKFCDKAIAYTEAPISFSQLFKQRLRWNYGNLQTFYKHRDMLFNKKHNALGMVFLPRALFIQVPSVLLTPIVDLFIIINLIYGQRESTVYFISLYFLTQFIVTLIAYLMLRQSYRDLPFLLFLRFPYAQIMYIVFYISVLQAIRGEIITWSKLHHTGRFTPAFK